ncbi:MAG TPA: non-heme iron oxygenase ferredoxin subunit [Roseomonas sp.]|jgi:nitrite reductase/ring-hydroxylating ferredoxin subunit
MSGTEALHWVRVASLAEIGDREAVAIEHDGHQIALFLLEGGEIRATDNVCTHAYALLTDGWVEEGVIECPLHGGRFDVRSGCGLGAPITRDLKTWPVRVTEGEIFIGIAAPAA